MPTIQIQFNLGMIGIFIATKVIMNTTSPPIDAVNITDFLIPTDGSWSLVEAPTSMVLPNAKKQLKTVRKQIAKIQEKLYADNRYSVLLVFQAMDAAGKDSTIRSVLKGVNPAGCQVYSFKQPSKEELDHDFLWRTTKALPERGRIGVFNRSHYEETLVVRVHPEYLGGQNLPDRPDLDALWQQRFESIRQHEQHLARNGTVILKFWLNVSSSEQQRRFQARLERPSKHWKYSSGDLDEAAHWNDYMQAYADMLPATSTATAPWFAIPADDKPTMRAIVATIIADKLSQLDLAYPTPDFDLEAELARLSQN